MISIKFKMHNGDVDISVRGHGPRIICAMISGMAQACIYGMLCMADNQPDHVQIEGDIGELAAIPTD